MLHCRCDPKQTAEWLLPAHHQCNGFYHCLPAMTNVTTGSVAALFLSYQCIVGHMSYSTCTVSDPGFVVSGGGPPCLILKWGICCGRGRCERRRREACVGGPRENFEKKVPFPAV